MQVKRKKPVWLITLVAMIVPAAGHVLLGKGQRGLIFIFFMGFLGLVTFQLTNETISPIGRFAGTAGVWAISVLEAHRIAKEQYGKEVN